MDADEFFAASWPARVPELRATLAKASAALAGVEVQEASRALDRPAISRCTPR
jgi:hypothetical protein